ncbi:hypothetical protein [Aliikangiella sp. IMCC44359]|uniref:hypothetical protein n=1 Tax=Aliikangiella sp. IMCC44359 TaxID=3459125 RepID=UPI00403B2CB0
MLRVILFIFSIYFLVSHNVSAKEKDIFNWHPSLVGTWGGKWDGIFDVRITVTPKSDQEYSIVYEWREDQDKGFNKIVYPGMVVNANTIDFHKISLRISLKDKQKALAYGKFDLRTRIAKLTRIN